MQRLAILCGALMLVLTFWTSSAALAAPPVECGPVFSVETADFEGDRDEAPSCPQPGGAHHHSGCSGHQFAVPGAQLLTVVVIRNGESFAPEPFWKPGREPNGQLRPPIA